MAEGKFTPGPWVACLATKIPEGKKGISVGRRFAVYAHVEPQPHESEANAFAVAAVPELYEAVRVAREVIDRLTRGDILTAEEAYKVGGVIQGALNLADTGRR